MAKVSVLMAVRDAAAFLPESLDSLLRQTFGDWEAVCVDDASHDGSLALLRSYAARDPRVRVLSKPVGEGAFLARQKGFAASVGEYVTMLDADDWLAPDALERAVAVLDGDDSCDTVLYDLRQVSAGREEQFPLLTARLDGEEAFRRSLTWQIHGVSMMRRSVYGAADSRSADSPLSVQEQQLMNSDELMTQWQYLRSRGVAQCDGVYYYRQHEGATTRRVSVRRFEVLRSAALMSRYLAAEGASHKVREPFEQYRWLQLVDLCMFYHCHGRQLSPKERSMGKDWLRETWRSVDRRLLKKETTAKFGYRPCRWWWLFRVQEWLYFTLRGILGRNH